jgi:hypothetical protein
MNLECQNGSVTDTDGDAVTLHYNWYRNNVSLTVLNLPMDYDSGLGKTHDISGYGNDASVSGATFLPTGGKIGGGFTFSGTSSVNMTVPAAGAINNLSAFSASFWVYEISTDNKTAIIYKSNDNTDAGWWVEDNNGTLRFAIVYSSTNANAYAAANLKSSWNHVVVSSDGANSGTSLRMYLNGVEVSYLSRNAGTGVHNTDASVPLFIGTGGMGSYGSMNSLNGTLDEVMIFNRSLSPEEVKTLYDSNNRWMNYTELRRNESWNCSITPVDATGLNGSTVRSNATRIIGSAPLNATLLYPAHNNQTVFERFVNFTWNASNELDGDQVNYSLNLTTSGIGGCAIQTQQTNLQSTNYTFGELCTDSYYNWTVKACDIDGCSGWTTVFNFSIASVTSIRLLNNNTNFGSLTVGQTIDTSDNVVMPFWIENDGNVFVNVTVVANNSPFTSVGLNNIAFQYKARANESNAFDTSTSPLLYTPLNASYTNACNRLNYTDATDAAFIDINITVPINEPPGNKVANISFLGTS